MAAMNTSQNSLGWLALGLQEEFEAPKGVYETCFAYD